MPAAELRALSSLQRLRHIETDEARRGLGEALAHETALASRNAAIEAEVNEARQTTGEFDRQAFAAWFGRKLIEKAGLAEAMTEAAERTAAARTELAHRRVAETTAEEALARLVLLEETAAAGRDQIVLEDVSRSMKRTDDNRRSLKPGRRASDQAVR